MNDVLDFGVEYHGQQIKLSILGEEFYLSGRQFDCLENLLNSFEGKPKHSIDFGYYKLKDQEVRAFAEERKPSDLLRMLGMRKRIDNSDLGDI